MTYPQPNSNAPLANGQQFYRLKTPMGSGGDIYESEQGCQAVYVGPDSDFSTIACAYFDPQNPPTFLSQFSISPTRGFVGSLNARLDTAYQPANMLGRIMFYPADAFDILYRPLAFVGANDGIVIETPTLDVIQYLAAPQVPPPARADKWWHYQNYNPTAATGVYWIVIPFWGRGSATVQLTNKSGQNCTFGITGLRYAICDNTLAAASRLHQESVILAAAAVASGATPSTTIVKTSTFGKLDALVLSVQFAAGATFSLTSLDVVTSDAVQ
jgi:hypothetical protein